jgi:alkylation response protein AidB-like acyl-CoA dehydrogenase
MSMPHHFSEQAPAFALTGEDVGQRTECARFAGVLVGLGVNHFGVGGLRSVLRHAAQYHRHSRGDRLLSHGGVEPGLLRDLLQCTAVQLLLHKVKDSTHRHSRVPRSTVRRAKSRLARADNVVWN